MNEPKSARYQRLTRRARAVEIATGAAWIAVLAFTPGARWLAHAASAPFETWPGQLRTAAALTSFVGLVVLLRELLVLPAVLYLGVRIDRRFGRAERTRRRLVADHLQASGLALVAAVGVAGIVVGAATLAGEFWWLTAGVLLAVGLAAAMRIAGALLPAWSHAKPIARRSLMSALREIARDRKSVV